MLLSHGPPSEKHVLEHVVVRGRIEAEAGRGRHLLEPKPQDSDFKNILTALLLIMNYSLVPSLGFQKYFKIVQLTHSCYTYVFNTCTQCVAIRSG